MKKIPLNKGKFALVDDEDFDKLSQYKWFVNKQRNFEYARRVEKKKDGKRYSPLMHREIMGITNPKILVDHKDHNTFNNQKNNLRVTNAINNAKNRTSHKNATSKYLGVYWCKRDKRFIATICVKGKINILGRFKDEVKAAEAYDEGAKKYHGEFANLNFKK